ncbi:hypothetical protein ALC56_13670 [Trachymyrmex septentrionalis]|uniref:Uncharacterized protein n=1 Tax=Trachymyrmex septentrionalis TaxID=34720 RepID=A0A195EVI9_9HYME|nr:hypothetical protein ALC56_13670 [Trachymyrmex septentrionalis]
MTLRCCSCCTHKSSPSDTGIQHVRPAQEETGLYTFAKVNAQVNLRFAPSSWTRFRRSAFGVARAGARPRSGRSERAATEILFPWLPLRGHVLYDDGKGIRLQSDITHSIQEKTLCDNCRVIYSRWTAVNDKDFESFRNCDRIFSCTYADKRIVEGTSARERTGFKLNLTELSSTLELP